MTTEISRAVHEGVRLTTTEMIVIDVGFRPREVADQAGHVADAMRRMTVVGKRTGQFPATISIRGASVFGSGRWIPAEDASRVRSSRFSDSHASIASTGA